MAYDYIVCDRRDEGGSLEMVHIMGHSEENIREQVAKIISARAQQPSEANPPSR